MARPDTRRVDGTTIPVAGQRQDLPSISAARPVNTFAPNQSAGAKTQQLLQSLSGLDRTLGDAYARYDRTNTELMREAGDTQGRQLDTTDPVAAANAPRAYPPRLDMAYANEFDRIYNAVVGQRLAAQVDARIRTAYEEQKRDPSFDIEGWLPKAVEEQTKGLQDPQLKAAVAERVSLSARDMRSDFAGIQYLRTQQKFDESARTIFGAIEADGSPEAAVQTWNMMRKQGDTVGFDKARLATTYFGSVTSAALRTGNLALLDAIDRVPSDGMTWVQRHPEYGDNILRLRAQIEADNQRKLKDATSIEDGVFRASLKASFKENAEQYTSYDAVVRAVVNGASRFGWEPGTTAGFITEGWKLAQDEMDTRRTVDLIQRAGYASLSGLDSAPAALERIMKPEVEAFMAASASDNPQAQVTAAQRLVEKAISVRAPLPQQVKDTINAVALVPPASGQPPSPNFVAAAALYRSMPPDLAKATVGEREARVLGEYSRAVQAGLSPAQAGAAAFRQISPEVERMLADPEFRKQQAKASQGYADELKPRWSQLAQSLFGESSPDAITGWVWSDVNERRIAARGRQLVEESIKRNPALAEDSNKEALQAHVDALLKGTFAWDRNTRSLIEVGPALGGMAFSPQIEMFSKAALDQARGAGGNVSVEYDQQRQQFVSYLQVPGSLFPTELSRKDARQLQQDFERARVMTPADERLLGDTLRKQSLGVLTPAIIAERKDVLEKARMLGRDKSTIDTILGPMRSTTGLPALNSPLMKPQGFLPSDRTMTAADLKASGPITLDAAKNVLSRPNLTGTDYAQGIGLLGERLMTTRHPDPNPAAGDNIGPGYNLKANSGVVTEHLRMAGVPVDKIEGVIAGKVAMTPAQATQLQRVFLEKAVLPKVVPIVNDIGKDLGLGDQAFERLPPHVQGVVLDLAYQGGPKLVAGFPKAMRALLTGDYETAKKELVVTFESGAGRKPDTRRNAIRNSFLTDPAGVVKLIRESDSLASAERGLTLASSGG